jgi:hypothetical protein
MKITRQPLTALWQKVSSFSLRDKLPSFSFKSLKPQLPRRSFVLALLGIGSALATIALLRTFGFPQVPALVPSSWQLPRPQFDWNTVGILAFVAAFAAAVAWTIIAKRREKARAVLSNTSPLRHSVTPVPTVSAALVTPLVTPVVPIPPATRLVTPTPPAVAPATPFVAISVPAATTPTPATPPIIAPTKRRRATTTATPPPASPAPTPATAGAQQTGGAPTGWWNYLGYIGLAFGLAATLVLFFSKKGEETPAPEESQTEETRSAARAPMPRAARGIVLNVGDEVTVKAGKECSPTYKPVAEKIIRIIGVNPERHYLVKTVSGQYEMGPGLPPVPGAIPRVSICSLDDEPVEVWMAVEEPPRPAA